MSAVFRNERWAVAAQTIFDVAIIGGGINGACLYHHLCREGYQVLLVDKGDFASGTSQASAMMVWGGLLYLRNWRFAAVRHLCDSRDRLIRDMGDWVRPRAFRYLPAADGRHSPALVGAGLYSYWVLGGCRRLRPRREIVFPELAFLNGDRLRGSLVYEEACVEPSDARFVLLWVLPQRDARRVALNYCSLQGGGFDRSARQWHLELTDTLESRQCLARARWVVNAAGVWTDSVNRRFGLEFRHKHVFSKGVFVGIPRDSCHEAALVFETRKGRDWMSLFPWGSVSLWGPTETFTSQLEESFAVCSEDIRLLLDELNMHLAQPAGPRNIVSVRCGVRALAVDRSLPEADVNTVDLSRRYWIDRHPHLPWTSLYGGKMTDCVRVASAVTRIIRGALEPILPPSLAPPPVAANPQWHHFPGLPEEVLSATWCAENEMCCTLEDYLRRRTNIAQWVPRGGLGFHNENLPHLVSLAKVFAAGRQEDAQGIVATYRRKVEQEFDAVLATC